MGRGQGTKDRKKRGDAKRAGEPAQSSPVVPLLSITIGILACALVYLNLDALGLGAVQSSTTPGPTESGASSTSSHAVGSDERRENSPDPCVKLRQAANNHFRAGRIQHGLEQLMKCAELSPTARAHWDVGVQLAKLKDYENGLSWMDQAILLNHSDPKYRSGAGLVSTKAGRWADAKAHYEVCMELLLRLEPGTWGSTLLNSVSEHEAEMVWIKDESPESLDRLQSLLFLYLKLQELVYANAAFKILTKLQPHKHDLHRQYADFLAGQGLVLDSTAVLMADLRMLITEKYSVHTDSYGFANLHGLLYLAGGLDSNFVNLGRTLLLTTDDAALTTLRTNCKLPEALEVSAGQTDVPTALLRGILARCLDAQGVVGRLMDTGSSTDVKNGFEYAPLHYAAMFGSTSFLTTVVNAQPLLDAKTSVGHTAVHLAAIRGYVNLLPQLYLAGVSKEAKDRKGRTVIDIACMHRYAAANVTGQFGGSPEEHCNPKHLIPTTAPLPTKSLAPAGWRKPKGLSGPPPESRCDFDVRTDLSVEEFLFDYLALQRPLLIRSATKGTKWDRLRRAWSRKQLATDYGDTLLHVAEVPYAEAFGLNTTEITLSEFLRYMDNVHNRGAPNPKRIPDYAFESLPAEHPLTRDMQMPEALNPVETEIIPQSVQFYVGPAGSGAPMHVHRSAYNVQVAGRKSWALLPPPYALYSKEPAGRFFSTRLAQLKQSGSVVMECVQEAGDVVFVPGTWGHATLNLEESIGYASEFVWGGDEFSVSEELLEAEEIGSKADESVGQGIAEDEE